MRYGGAQRKCAVTAVAHPCCKPPRNIQPKESCCLDATCQRTADKKGPVSKELREDLTSYLTGAVNICIDSLKREMKTRGSRPAPRKSDLSNFAWLIRYKI